MQVYFAPLEGVTDSIYRRAHHAMFSGVEKYFIPFISPSESLTFSSREQRAIDPRENAGVPVIPQLLTRDADRFAAMTKLLSDCGYREVNLNLGCPSGTVTAKGKGSGMLRDLGALRAFLDAIFVSSALPISIKTRIGYQSIDEWGALLELLNAYPASEMIVHMRTKAEFYRGHAHRELCAATMETLRAPFVYNGDLFTIEDLRAFESECPNARAVMLGRGLIANPALAETFAGGETLSIDRMRAFHDSLLQNYTNLWPQKAVLGHMQEITQYMLTAFESPMKARKAVRKAKTIDAYLDAVNLAFDTLPLRESPGFYLNEIEF
ncbi:MAG: tRNA-dihydrouridine synthase family protein [Clostridia bacterium]|nr:tRNA-dihydrouridine synthase family protein [Clostridia bacterium]